jgi:hypothetical protein
MADTEAEAPSLLDALRDLHASAMHAYKYRPTDAPSGFQNAMRDLAETMERARAAIAGHKAVIDRHRQAIAWYAANPPGLMSYGNDQPSTHAADALAYLLHGSMTSDEYSAALAAIVKAGAS